MSPGLGLPPAGALETGLLPTASGRWIDPWDIRPETVAIEDLIFGQANECRWTSQIARFYSVAQHAVLVSLHVPTGKAFAGLLHDGSEAWLHDLAPQFKARWSDYLVAEARAMDAIADRFGLPRGFHRDPDIVAVDQRIRVDELRQLKGLTIPGQGLGLQLHPAPPAHAAAMFADRFFELWREWQ